MEDLYLYTTIAIIPLVVLTLIAGFVVQFRFAKYSKENNLSGLTGAQAARKILDEHGLFDVAIVRIEGNLTDNFNPKTNVVSLSPKVHDGNTIAAVAVAGARGRTRDTARGRLCADETSRRACSRLRRYLESGCASSSNRHTAGNLFKPESRVEHTVFPGNRVLRIVRAVHAHHPSR